MTDLETKIQKLEEEQTGQNNGELLFAIALTSISMKCYTYIINVNRYMNTYWMVLAANRKVAALETQIQRIVEQKTEEGGELLFTIIFYSIPM